MRTIFLYLWQLPQNLLGLLLIAILGIEEKEEVIDGARIYFSKRMLSGISLGRYIILNTWFLPTEGKTGIYGRETRLHEWGHSKQSKYLGWLYLIIIGLPSLLGNIYDRLFHGYMSYYERIRWYYNLPWEKWADKLGGVKR